MTCGNGKLLERDRWTNYEVVFMINKIVYGLDIGYVFGSIQDVDFQGGLGFWPNEKNSVGICIGVRGAWQCSRESKRSKVSG